MDGRQQKNTVPETNSLPMEIPTEFRVNTINMLDFPWLCEFTGVQFNQICTFPYRKL